MGGGDFNVVLSISEISGGHTHPQEVINAFNLTLLDCGLKDAGFIGNLFIRTNRNT